ncbi:complex I NDUFA9 subunit family protein [Halomonas lysinitropha]|uniref:NAD dependent epimerase/dehydratase family protein n=1 Tax=Halomonas lysinitropha TaxID=2607506 RepID=A0A5K1IBI1_9GAMM|nr:complex I NDUFA9 subunit family protein [Halomonas lysinitropha]VVZ95579.1 NAD dependent epimerase/dehydratase family protein [Halomonas lysinitropha]
MREGLVTVFGGTGFLGDAIVRELVEAGREVRIAARHPALPAWLEDGDPVELATADIRDEESLAAALEDASAVVNAVSLYVETRDTSFEAIHVTGAWRLASQARAAGIERLVQVSGIGTRHDSASAYVRARARGEEAVLDAIPKAIIVRPSVLFGPGDAFLSGLEGLTRLPLIPLFGRGTTRLQPVHVVDVARAIAVLAGRSAPGRRLFELGGPDVLSYREILETLLGHLHRERPLVPIPFLAWRLVAALAVWLPGQPLTRDQVILMQTDNIADENVGGFRYLDIIPRSLRESLPACLPPHDT